MHVHMKTNTAEWNRFSQVGARILDPVLEFRLSQLTEKKIQQLFSVIFTQKDGIYLCCDCFTLLLFECDVFIVCFRILWCSRPCCGSKTPLNPWISTPESLAWRKYGSRFQSRRIKTATKWLWWWMDLMFSLWFQAPPKVWLPLHAFFSLLPGLWGQKGDSWKIKGQDSLDLFQKSHHWAYTVSWVDEWMSWVEKCF